MVCRFGNDVDDMAPACRLQAGISRMLASGWVLREMITVAEVETELLEWQHLAKQVTDAGQAAHD